METNFTSGLKQAILHHHPNCRVMIPGNQVVEFSILDSEYQAWAEDYYEYVYTIYEHNLDFDIDILQLPALHQLNVGFMQNDSTPYENLEEVLSYIVTSPGLKHLSLDHHFDVLEFPLGKLKEKWHDFVVAHPSKQTSQLESLRILGRGLGEGIIFKFAATGSLSNLHTLELFSDDPENLAKVGQLLPSLEKLLIQIRVKSTHDEGYIKFATAIRAFHPVKYLSLHYFPWVEGLHQIVKHHGVSLKGLILHFPYLGHHPKHAEPKASDIDRLALDCPNLEELRLEVPRSLGNQSECDIYKAFGRFSKLRSLFLGLNFDRRMDRRGPCNDTQEVELHLKTFMNAATDEKLALGIWHLVNIEAPCLQYLRIFPFAHEFSWGEECLLKYLTHSYLITRYNFQNPESPYIEEIGKRLWEVEREGDGWAQNDYYHLCEEISQLPRKIWPPVPGKGDWRDCWSSFPLQPEGKAVETLHMPSSLL
ncbi:hypothetical protein N7478_002726 [Penicillium angulare]|uniref:uncharacterized protein n=1 Tax=Penicillium angulare TaxID=116970 RepID=UPI002540BC8F|nr:uncharacterized protein N7478_002726 [Penicillium angulare]KAJ5287040.1 hypothetical protein N7478_002726 [Penicillium angulare]